MSAVTRARLFEPFWRAPEHPHAGMGLGLFIAKTIVDAHRGSIWISSGVGEGTTMFVSLPASRVA